MTTQTEKKPKAKANKGGKTSTNQAKKTQPQQHQPQPNTVKATINGTEIETKAGTSIIKACDEAGIEIPRFCYHDKLKVAGNCRMCLVEVTNPKMRNLAASCATTLQNGMTIETSSDAVKKAREGVMEFLLINHPLDCPVCDKGGECELQDQSIAFGSKKSSCKEAKRRVEPKNFGELIKTEMNRCIHCTRCIRFFEDVAGVKEIGTFGRGENMEVATMLQKGVTHNMSGNIIDLCPVGALLSRPYFAKARPWEQTKTPSISISDAVGENIFICHINNSGNNSGINKGGNNGSSATKIGDEVVRILPRQNNSINGEFISDKARFSYDGLKNQRIDEAFMRQASGKLQQCSVNTALKAAANSINTGSAGIIIGTEEDIETMNAVKNIATNASTHPQTQTQIKMIDHRCNGEQFNTEKPENYLFNTKIANVHKADLIILIGARPYYEATIVNAEILKAVKNGATVFNIGEEYKDAYEVKNITKTAKEAILALLSPSSPTSDANEHKDSSSGSEDESAIIASMLSKLKTANKPMIIAGTDAITQKHMHDAIIQIAKIHNVTKKDSESKSNWNGLNFLHRHAGTVGALNAGATLQCQGGVEAIINAAETKQITTLLCINCDAIAYNNSPVTQGDKTECNTVIKRLSTAQQNGLCVIYLGTHGDAIANIADIIIPTTCYAEKSASFANMEGTIQKTQQATKALGSAQNTSDCITALQSLISPSASQTSAQASTAPTNGANKTTEHTTTKDLTNSIKACDPAKIFHKTNHQRDISISYLNDAVSRQSLYMAKTANSIIKTRINSENPSKNKN